MKLQRGHRNLNDVLASVQQFAKTRGRLPTPKEIQKSNGYLTLNGVSQFLAEAQRRGWVVIDKYPSGNNRYESYQLTGGAAAIAALDQLNGNGKPATMVSSRDLLGYESMLRRVRKALRGDLSASKVNDLIMEIDDLLLG